MRYFYIKLKLQIGEYEKRGTHVVRAKTKREAQIISLKGECHMDQHFDDDMEEDQQCWDGYEMIYSIESVKEITKEQLSQLFEITQDYMFLKE